MDPIPANLGRCIGKIPFKSAMNPFRVVISSLLSLSSLSFSFSHNSCRYSFILRVTGVIMQTESKIEAKVVRTSRFVFASSMFSSFFCCICVPDKSKYLCDSFFYLILWICILVDKLGVGYPVT